MKQAYSPLSGTLQRLADAFELQGLLGSNAVLIAAQNAERSSDSLFTLSDGCVAELISAELVNEEMLVDVSVYDPGVGDERTGYKLTLVRAQGRWIQPGLIDKHPGSKK